MGWLADYLSLPVLVGHIRGVAILLIVGQVPDLLGYDVQADTFLGDIADMVGAFGDLDPTTAAVGLVSLAVRLGLRWWPPLPRRLAGGRGGIAAWWLARENQGVATIGTVPAGLPGQSVPPVSLDLVVSLLPAAIGIYRITFSGSILTARAFAERHGERVDAGQEMLALSGGNVAAAF
jgi:SulP family sulfate permease